MSGALLIGSETCRLRNKVSITLYGSRSAQALPAAAWVKGISVTGSIDIHGARYFPTWTRLAMTARINDTWIFIQDIVNWQPGMSASKLIFFEMIEVFIINRSAHCHHHN